MKITKGVNGFKDGWLIDFGKKMEYKCPYDDDEILSSRYFVASGVVAMDWGGWEVLIFASDKTGKVTEWNEVAGGRNMTHEQAINDLKEVLK